MNRRGFLGSILAVAIAPAIVRADSLMRIIPTETLLVTTVSGNRLLRIEEITREALIIMEEHWEFPSAMEMGDRLTEFTQLGCTMRIRRPFLSP